MAVTDLTNTKWVFNSTITATAGYGVFDLKAEDADHVGEWSTLYVGYRWNPQSGEPISNANRAVWMGYIALPQGEFTITGGTDVTNSNLISWLTANATQIEPSSDVIETTISIGTSLLADASVGTAKLLKAFIGNHLIFERLGGNFLTSDGKLLLTSDNKIFNVQEASGYSGNILAESVSGSGVTTYIKFDTPPSNDDDYDAMVNPLGNIDGLTSYSNKSKVYVWGYVINSGTPKVRINNVATNGTTNYATAVEVTLDGNYDIYLGYAWGTG